jgi:hypothetical protein
MDREMQGVIDRVAELIDELSDEYQRHIEEPAVTERAKNLFHEALVKMRSAMDMVMMRVWDKYAPASLNPETREEIGRHVYFPVVNTEAKFDDRLKKKMKLDLARDNPALYALLRQSQPFATGRHDLVRLAELSNLGKHVRLANQVRSARPAKMLETSDGRRLAFTPGVEFHAETVMGIPTDPATRTPAAGLEDVDWVSFSVSGHDDIIDPTSFCLSLYTSLRRYIPKVLNHI